MAGMTSCTYSHQLRGKSIPGSPGLGCSGRVGLRGRGLLGSGVPNALPGVLTQENMHSGLQVRHHDAHRTQAIATARLMELWGSMLSVPPG